ncbi:GumC family protein [Mesorhizobium humile]|uniref:GNVR domain-containing protein n=1 Tax=Mesorhizobium humile TaxID=3072313 RepID=A0ABU4YEV2_9HYPH|nr:MULTISPECIES: GNVR domain-containing protein [unclassified Mesorhizobium]MDX8460419.1 GNVR domain-containing protein [Mesorhizobium sp. VK2D]MDX8485492.1 GNVR domain-containing protein [Mesorhizobium sp. VK2B]
MQSPLLMVPQQNAPEAVVPAPAYYAHAPAHATVELGDLGRILLRRRFLILAITALLTVLTLVYSVLTPALYSSTAQIIIDPQDLQVVTNDVNPSRISPDGGITQVESQVAVAQSNGVLLRAIKATNLTENPDFNGQGGLGRWLGMLFGSDDGDRTAETLDSLRRRLAVKRDDKVLVLNIIITAKSADLAAELANAIAQAYLDDQAQARSKAAADASDAISARLEDQRKRVEQAANAVETYKAEHNMVMAAGNLVSDQELTDLNTQLTAAQTRTAQLKAQVDQLRRQGGAPDATSEAMRSPVIASLRAQEATLVDQISQFGTALGPRHPSMISAQQQLSDLRKLISRELGRLVTAAETDYERALANQKELEAKVASLKGKSLDTDQASVRLRELQRDLEAVRTVYANYLQRAQETREQTNVNSTNARIISQAMPALKKSWPPKGLLVFGAIFGGLALGVGMALIAEYLSPTVLSANQMQSAIDAPVLGVLPGRGRRRSGGVAQKTDAVAGLALQRIAAATRRPPDWPLVPSILVASPPEDKAQRSRVAWQLANAAAARGRRVLFIDINAGKGQKDPQPGVLDVLRGEYPLDAVSRYAPGSSVALVGRGRPTAVFQEAQALYFAHRMLAEANRSFELVVVDGGALADDLNVLPLVAMADEILLVARLNATPMRDVASTSEAVSVMGRLPTGAMLVDEAA